MTPPPDRPIFILGPHRSGTTLLYKLLGRHPDLAYIDRAAHRFHRHPVLHALARLRGWGREPVEAQKIWDRRGPERDDRWTAADADEAAVDWYRRQVALAIRRRGGTRFVAKYPRQSLRDEWLDRVFPGCLFLHCVRDWRAVVASTVGKKVQREKPGHKGGWYGVRIPGWRDMGDLPHPDAAAEQYRVSTAHLEAAAERWGDRWLRVSYENDVCPDPAGTMRRVCEAFDLPWSEGYAARLPGPRRSRDDKWRKTLDEATLARIRATAPEFFAAHEVIDAAE